MSTAGANAIELLDPIPKTTEGLRDALFDEINAIRAGQINLHRARVLAQLATRIIDSVRVQVQCQKLIADTSGRGTPLGTVVVDAQHEV